MASKGRSTARSYRRALLLALATAVLVRGWALQAFRIPSSSMLPTLQAGDHLLVNKLSYGIRSPFGGFLLRYRQPADGDVIVFAHPRDHSKEVVKRVIATAGERVEMRDHRVFVDGVPRAEPFTYRASDRHANFAPLTVPADHVFVMGDNRDSSQDSRSWGFVPVRSVKGRALLVCWSWGGREHWVRWERIGMIVH